MRTHCDYPAADRERAGFVLYVLERALIRRDGGDCSGTLDPKGKREGRESPFPCPPAFLNVRPVHPGPLHLSMARASQDGVGLNQSWSRMTRLDEDLIGAWSRDGQPKFLDDVG